MLLTVHLKKCQSYLFTYPNQPPTPAAASGSTEPGEWTSIVVEVATILQIHTKYHLNIL